MPKEVDFGKIARRLEVNISALRVFTSEIGQLAKEHDKTILTQQKSDIAQLVGLSVEELEKLKGVSNLQAALESQMERAEKEEQEQETDTEQQLTDEQKAIIKKMAQVDGHEFLLRSRNFFRSSAKIPPIQAFILRRSALITLASYFEYLIAELIHSFYLLYPQALPSEERVLSLSELREIGSIEEAENHLIEREVDSLLRESVEKQLDYLSSKRIRVNLDQLENYKSRIIEIFQRRNIFVHNDGIVNKIYLSRVPKELLEENLEEGTRLKIEEEYLKNAIDNIFLSGVILTQLCWRKWHKEAIEAADSIYINLLYESLQEHQYTFITSLQDFSLNMEFTSDRSKRVAVVNHAIALRELKQTEKMEELINSLDWSSCSLEFRVALFALREEKDNLQKILPKAIAAKEIQKEHLEEWPLFAPFRESEEFIQLMEGSPDGIVLSE